MTDGTRQVVVKRYSGRDQVQGQRRATRVNLVDAVDLHFAAMVSAAEVLELDPRACANRDKKPAAQLFERIGKALIANGEVAKINGHARFGPRLARLPLDEKLEIAPA